MIDRYKYCPITLLRKSFEVAILQFRLSFTGSGNHLSDSVVLIDYVNRFSNISDVNETLRKFLKDNEELLSAYESLKAGEIALINQNGDAIRKNGRETYKIRHQDDIYIVPIDFTEKKVFQRIFRREKELLDDMGNCPQFLSAVLRAFMCGPELKMFPNNPLTFESEILNPDEFEKYMQLSDRTTLDVMLDNGCEILRESAKRYHLQRRKKYDN